MDLLLIAGLSIVMGIILVAMGLSFLSQSLKFDAYTDKWGTNTTDNYYQNPFFKLNSKYWHYRPKGSVVISKKKWGEIERNIGIEITLAEEKARKLGRAAAIIEIQDMVREEQARIVPASPYAVLDVEAGDALLAIEEHYHKLIAMYDPTNFKGLDEAFIELAEIRIEQFNKAWKSISFGVKMHKGDI